jgi:NADH-quinone oxidoreductase subunit G
MNPSVTLTIDGKQVTVPPGTTILEAARIAGIEIPVFCNHPKLEAIGACRMCLVEIEKVRAPQPACATPVRPDMVVRTDTPALIKARKTTLEFLLTNHPLDCPVCDKAGECELQDQVFKFGPGQSRFLEDKRHKQKAKPLSNYIIMDQERCVLCRRCIRFLEEWADDVELGLFERGRKTCVDTFPGDQFRSLFSGNTIDLCPVGAITSRLFRFSARSWELQRTDSICQNCAVGCNTSLHVKVNRLKRITARENGDVNDEWLCDRGRFDHHFADPAGRLLTPMLRRDGRLAPATWEEALDAAAAGLRQAAMQGGAAVAGVGSALASDEANFLLARLTRSALDSPNLDFEGAPPAGAQLLPTTRVMDRPGVVIVAGIDLQQEAPLLELLGRHGGLLGCTRFIVVYPQATRLARWGVWLQTPAGAEAEALQALARACREAGAGATPAGALGQAATLLACAKARAIVYGGAAAYQPAMSEALSELTAAAACEPPAYIPAQANVIGAWRAGVTPDAARGGLSLAGMVGAAQAGALKAVYALGRPPAGLAGVGFMVVQASWLGDVPASANVALPACTFAEAEGSYTNLCGRSQIARPALRPAGQSRPGWWIAAQIGARLGPAEAWAFDSAGAVRREIERAQTAG